MKTILLSFFLVATYSNGFSTNENTFISAQRFDYEADFEAFKDAVKDKDKETIKSMSSENVDIEMLFMIFDDPDYNKKLQEAKYDELNATEYMGNTVVALEIYFSAVDAEGNLFESGVTLYFDEGGNGLELVNYIAAG